MTQKGANTTLVKKRLKAVCIRLSSVRERVGIKVIGYSHRRELAEARNILAGLLPSIERAYDKYKAGSFLQRTLLERRIKALELSIQAIDKSSSK